MQTNTQYMQIKYSRSREEKSTSVARQLLNFAPRNDKLQNGDESI